jgi:hypothetical protein
VGKVALLGNKFTFTQRHMIKEILLDKSIFPEIVSVDVNSEKQGFGYFTITLLNSTRRLHIHWYELVVRILADHIIHNQENKQEYYRRVFLNKEEPVNLLFNNYYKTLKK